MDANKPVDPIYGRITLANGNSLNIANPDPNDIDIGLIANALGKLCRFSGQISEFYSVAQHSVLVSSLVPEEYRFQALMHDATEAFCADLPRPIKQLLPGYSEIEERVWGAICERFNLPHELHESIHIADRQAVLAEARDLIGGDDWVNWHPGINPAPIKIQPISWQASIELFLIEFHQLATERHYA